DPSAVRSGAPGLTRAIPRWRLFASSTKCHSGGTHAGASSLLYTVRRPRGVSNFHSLEPPSLTSVLPLPVATWVVNRTCPPCLYQRRLSSLLTTRYGRSVGGSAAVSAWWMLWSSDCALHCTLSSRPMSSS